MSNNTITVRFFARLREELATDMLTLEPTPGLTAGQLLAQLAAKGAINQTMAKASHPVHGGDEIAFFPPVTGG